MNQVSTNSSNQNPPPPYHLGKLWQQKGKLSLAIKHYQDAVQTNPDYLPTYLQLGSLLLQQGKRESAIEIYHQAEKLTGETNYSSQVLALLSRLQKSTKYEHILFYSDRGEVYGAEQINHSLMCGFDQAGKKVTCVQPEDDNYLVTARKQLGIDHYWLQPDNIYGYRQDNFKVAIPKVFTDAYEPTQIFATAKPDLIIFTDSCPLSSLVAKEIAIAMNIPYITLVHCVKPEWANHYAPFLDRLPNTYEQAKAVIAVSDENLNLLHKLFGLNIDKGRVIYNGRPQQFFTPRCLKSNQHLRQQLNIPEKAIVLFTSARLDQVKGYQYQLEAIKLLQQTPIWSQLYFVWAGTGNLKTKIKETLTTLNAEQQVILLGESDQVADLLNLADIFILPSEIEGMPLSVMEAMAKGVPVIASAVSGIPEELGDTGKLVADPKISPQATVEQLVKTILAWAQDDTLRHNIGQVCQKRAISLFSEDRMIANYLNLIATIDN